MLEVRGLLKVEGLELGVEGMSGLKMVVKKIKQGIFQMSFGNFGGCVYFLKVNNVRILIDVSSKENEEELVSYLS